jgi:hypothetical protein
MDQTVEWLSKNWFDEVPQIAVAGVGVKPATDDADYTAQQRPQPTSESN